jgi:UDP-N-acetylglucosamine 2-epimerase (non-hydrolysing)
MKKLLFIFGTRPEAIKMALLIRKFKQEGLEFECKVCVTAQHREMLDQVLSLFEIHPDFDLNIMKVNQSLSELTTSLIKLITNVLELEKPDLVFIHGDTTTSFSASLASYYLKIPVAHVEAGLRTNDIYNPWPEEINRKLIASIAKYHFAPTLNAKNNLINENVLSESIEVTGNTVVDSLLEVSNKIDNDNLLKSKLARKFSFITPNKKLILVTGHRRESFGSGFESICLAIKFVAENRPESYFVYPVHLNPNVRNIVHKHLGGLSNVFLLEPLDYIPFVYLMKKSYLILTDSGGVQEEAPSLNKHVLVMRDKTERIEALDTGGIKLVGTNYERISSEIINFLDNDINDKILFNPFGDGMACDRILKFIKHKII